MIHRTTHMATQRTSLANMQKNLAAMAALQEQASSGRRINKVSDDPSGAADALSLRREQTATAQHARNAQDGQSWLNLADSALTSTSSLLRRARDLVVQGSNTGTMNGEAREAIAAELEGIKEVLLDQANTTYLGRHIFAGTSGADYAFDPTTYTYSGVPAASVERRTSDTSTVRVDTDGAEVFGTSTDPASPDYSVFALIDDVTTTIRSGGNPQSALNQIDDRLTKVWNASATVGARSNQLERAASFTQYKSETLKNDIAGIENVDFAQTIIELKLQEVAYTSSLNATSRVLQPSLLEYLR
ncbi:flagellar hook-associated protein FlgL [Timonella sp. A28]|uniref:flagellar hook-associated protein FlgL n=1 Tax=Timonella sp. A28 TaxID=3442640 RepID=UPI003EBC8D1F